MTRLKNWDILGRKSLLGRLEARVRGSDGPLKEKIAQAIYRLQSQLGNLQQTSIRLQQRDKDMFERCVGAKLSGDESHAILYANECVEIRKMAKIVMASELALERVILRLQTVEEFGDVLAAMAPVVGIIKETKSKLVGVLPEVSRELEDINTLLSDTLIETGEATSIESNLGVVDSEARGVLEEAMAVAEQKLNEKFPELPALKPKEAQPSEEPQPAAGQVEEKLVEMETPAAAPQPQISAPLEVSSPVNESVAEKASKTSPAELEQKVLEYIEASGGELSVKQCASSIGVSPDEVRQTIRRLSEEGKIRLA